LTSPTTTAGSTRGCPTAAPAKVPAHQVPGTHAKMVPGAPNGLVGCRYPPGGALAGSARLAPGPVAAALNGSPLLPAGAVFHCPSDTGAKDLLLFRYADGSQLTISVARSGCLLATNGDVTARPAMAAVLAVLGPDGT
jgi:hypothetical protein